MKTKIFKEFKAKMSRKNFLPKIIYHFPSVIFYYSTTT